jgi:hypothetical protein
VVLVVWLLHFWLLVVVNDCLRILYARPHDSNETSTEDHSYQGIAYGRLIVFEDVFDLSK